MLFTRFGFFFLFLLFKPSHFSTRIIRSLSIKEIHLTVKNHEMSWNDANYYNFLIRYFKSCLFISLFPPPLFSIFFPFSHLLCYVSLLFLLLSPLSHVLSSKRYLSSKPFCRNFHLSNLPHSAHITHT